MAFLVDQSKSVYSYTLQWLTALLQSLTYWSIIVAWHATGSSKESGRLPRKGTPRQNVCACVICCISGLILSPHQSRNMAAVWESVPCWFTFFLERSRLVWTPVSNGMYSLRTSMLCKTFASPIQLVSSENLLLENFISWEKSCETGKFLRNF